MTEPRGGRNSSKSKGHGKTFDDTSSAASSPGASQRKHTPATIPRTKFTSATPLEQRIAINRLKQRLDYDEKDEVFLFVSYFLEYPSLIKQGLDVCEPIT